MIHFSFYSLWAGFESHARVAKSGSACEVIQQGGIWCGGFTAHFAAYMCAPQTWTCSQAKFLIGTLPLKPCSRGPIFENSLISYRWRFTAQYSSELQWVPGPIDSTNVFINLIVIICCFLLSWNQTQTDVDFWPFLKSGRLLMAYCNKQRKEHRKQVDYTSHVHKYLLYHVAISLASYQFPALPIEAASCN